MNRVIQAANNEAEFNNIESEVRYYSRQYPVVFDGAKDHLLTTESGEQYIDFLSGAGSLNYGHNPDSIMKEVISYLQYSKILNSLDLDTSAKRAFITALNDIILKPRDLDYKIQFTGPTGTNAVEAALKLARKVTQRHNIVAFTNGFHGMTLGALAATGNSGKRQAAGIGLHGITHMPFDGYYGENINTIELIERHLQDASSGLELPAAFLIETVQGEGGLNVASDDWLKALANLAKRYEILLIVDDIQAGCGRTGKFFSFESAAINPDIVCLSKSISGCGLPMAINLLKPELDIWDPGEHNGTFRGNNLAFVAARAALELWSNDMFEAQISKKSALVNEQLSAAIAELSPAQARVVGKGLLQGIEFQDPSIATQIMHQAFEQGLIVETCGSRDQVIKLMPPINITESALNQGLAIARDAIAKAISPLIAQTASS